MSINDLTIHQLGEDGLKTLAAAGSILTNVQGNGIAPDGDRFVNTPDTWLVLYQSGHSYNVIFTITPPAADIQTHDYGKLDLDNIVCTHTPTSPVLKITMLKIPVGYNVDGKVIIKTTSSEAFVAGEARIAAVEIL